ncbi:MAG: IS66 family insertion sequence element accessory protein TnpB [Deltaproteobacteria bacterium]|nr:IS66 family insertion sequence element accessory protein TnpB [Deltaproteobacteria bacterium]
MARETRAAWARRVERWQRSGLSAGDFADREGVNVRTLAFWKWRLKRDGGDEDASKPARGAKRVAFVELAPASAAALSPGSETRIAPIEVVLPLGYRVRIAPGFERSALVELLDILEARQ